MRLVTRAEAGDLALNRIRAGPLRVLAALAERAGKRRRRGPPRITFPRGEARSPGFVEEVEEIATAKRSR